MYLNFFDNLYYKYSSKFSFGGTCLHNFKGTYLADFVVLGQEVAGGRYHVPCSQLAYESQFFCFFQWNTFLHRHFSRILLQNYSFMGICVIVKGTYPPNSMILGQEFASGCYYVSNNRLLYDITA